MQSRFRPQALAHAKHAVSRKWCCLGPGGTWWTLPRRQSQRGLSKSESPQKTRQHAQESHSMETKKMQKEAHAALHKGILRCRRITQEAADYRKECWGLELHGARRTLWKDANRPWQLQKT
ncbi:hypothetical protein NDU88_000722 [Pleurodeles waltl]|uniref:Uncharacterized protein n=1 Tax=Pleurodeles waltl TaxID=8319 RepID=A0AAV7US48_PLEWA|nr:hypothetical protein NDU88_000722 [Pleurodeles waltl]